MYDADDIFDDFITKKVVTLRRATGDFPLEDILVARSSSGYKFQSHPLVTIDTLDQLKELSDVQEYNVANTYQIDEVVDDSGTIYESLIADNTNVLTDTDSWRETTQLSIQHRKRVYEAIVDVLNQALCVPDVAFSETIKVPYNPNLQQIQNDDNNVGLCIFGISDHVKLLIKLALQFTASETVNFTIKDQNTTLFTDTIDAETGITYKDVIYEVTGRGPFFITYDQATVTNNGTFSFVPRSTKWFSTSGVQTKKTDFTLIDSSDYFNFNYGWNYEVTVQSDLTDYIKQNIFQISEAVSLQYAYNFLEELLVDPHVRTNRNQRNFNREYLIAELKEETVKSLNRDLIRAIRKVKKSFANRKDEATQAYETTNWLISF